MKSKEIFCINRRQLLATSIGATLTGISLPSHAQAYPNRPVKIIVPYPPGGGADILARTFAANSYKFLNQPVVIENRPGAMGLVGSTLVADAQADGYTLLFSPLTPLAIAPSLIPTKINNSFFSPIGAFAFSPQVIVSAKFNSMNEMSNKQINFATPGNGSLQHLMALMVGKTGGLQVMPVHYKGVGPALTEVVSGRADACFCPIPAAVTLVDSGKLKCLAITTQSQNLPSQVSTAPTFEQAGFGEAAINEWYGLFGSSGMALNLVDQLNKMLIKVLEVTEIQQKILQIGAVPQISSPEQLSQLLNLYASRLSKVIKDEGIKLES